MRCHYEVLDLPRNADDADIKRNYRKLALQSHPDKNPDNLEESTRIFHEVQSAYEVLIDKQERAFYDKHREAILKGGDDYVDDSLDILHYFNPGVYCGFEDGAKGFYTVFRDVFQKISQEDEPYLEGDSDYEVPEFGDSKSVYDDIVKPFYSYWLGYCTKKSFVWKEKYDLRQAPNRPTQRLMEKENKKLRDAAKKERNEEVRALVAYVRKRDKRAQTYRKELEAKQAENQRKLEKKREDDIRKNNQVLDNYKEQEWMAFDQSKLDSIDSHFDEQFGGKGTLSDDSDDEIVDHFYCIACDKNFKSEKALANHEKSKKHRQNVELIKNELADDLLEDLHIDTTRTDEKENKNSDLMGIPNGYERLSSLNLPENVVKLNVIEKTEITLPGGDKNQEYEYKNNADKNENDDSMIRRTTDSLVYTKIKGSSASKGSVKVKEKKKKSKQYKTGDSDDDENDEIEWKARHDHSALLPQDSLVLPRKKTKKQELRESVDRVRQEDVILNTPDGLIDASLGRSNTKSSTTDSFRLKRPTKSDRKKGRRKLLDIDENNSASDDDSDDLDDDDDNDDNVFDGYKDTLDVDSNRAGLLDSIRYNKEHMEHHGKHILQQKHKDRQESLQDHIETKEKSTKTSSLKRVPDSIRYNKEHMEHHGKNILQSKHEERQENSQDNIETKEKVTKTSSLKRVPDSIRYNKEHMEHHGKNILQQKHEERKVNSQSDAEITDKIDTKRVPDSIRYNKVHMEHHGKNILQQKQELKKVNEQDSGSDESKEDSSSEAKKESEEEVSKNEADKKVDLEKSKRNSQEVYTGLFSCTVCEKDFPTRNKLFEHIRVNGHAMVKGNGNGSSKKKKGKNKKM